MPKKEIVLIHKDPDDERVQFVVRQIGDRYSTRPVSDITGLGRHVFDGELYRALETAHRVIYFYRPEETTTAEEEAARYIGLLEVLSTQNRDKLIIVCTREERETLPHSLRIGSFMLPDSAITLNAYLSTSQPLRGTFWNEMYNVGASMAVGYMCGYVNWAYDGTEEKPGLKQLMEQTKAYKEGRCSNKLNNLFPKGYTMPDSGIEDGERIFLVRAGENQTVYRDGGIPDRLYTCNFYRVLDRDGTEYYLHAEFATPLTSLKMMVDARFKRLPPSRSEAHKRRAEDMSFLQNEMNKYIRMLELLDQGQTRSIQYDETAPGFSSDDLADLLVNAVKADVSGNDVTSPHDDVALQNGVDADGDRPVEDEILVLPLSKLAQEEMSSVVEELEKMEAEGRAVTWADQCPLGVIENTWLSGCIQRAKYFVLLRPAADEANAQSNTILNDVLCGVTSLDVGKKSMVVVSDVTLLSDVTRPLSPFFVKWINNWRTETMADNLRNALSGDIRAIEYLNIGQCLAVQYFHSYLMYKVPELDTLFEHCGNDWTIDGVEIPKKLMVILQSSPKERYPDDLASQMVFKVDKKVKEPKTLIKMRGGARRPYPSTIYRVQHDGKNYYTIAEFIACNNTICVVRKRFNLTEAWLRQEVKLFKKTLADVIFHHPEVLSRLQVVEWDDDDEFGNSLSAVIADKLLHQHPDDSGRRPNPKPHPLADGSAAPTLQSARSEITGSTGYMSSTASTDPSDVMSETSSLGSAVSHHTCARRKNLTSSSSQESQESTPASSFPYQASLSPSTESQQRRENGLHSNGTHSNGRLHDDADDESMDITRGLDDVTVKAGDVRDVSPVFPRSPVSVSRGNNASVRSLNDYDESEFRDVIHNLPRSSSRNSLGERSLGERSRASTLNRSEVSEDEFWDASEGNRTLGSLGDESFYQSIGDVSTQYFSDDDLENSDISTLSPDDTPNSSNCEKPTFPKNLNASSNNNNIDSALIDSATAALDEYNFALSDDSNFSSLEELPSVRLAGDDSGLDPRSRDWQPVVYARVAYMPRARLAVWRRATRRLIRELGEEAGNIVGGEVVNTVQRVGNELTHMVSDVVTNAILK